METEELTYIGTDDFVKKVWLSLQGNGRLITMRLESLSEDLKKATFRIIENQEGNYGT